MVETFYDVLGVGRDATQAEIESAYRERVKETHPDLNDSASASDAFQRVQEAEDVLGDPDERARYDRLGHASYTRTFGGASLSEGHGWDFGADRSAAAETDREEADRNRGFGFDPGEYDRTRASGEGNPSQRSYDVSDAGRTGSSASTSSASSSTASSSGGADDGGATASANGAGGGGSGGGIGGPGGAGGAHAGRSGPSGTGARRNDETWQERARRTEREWSKAAQRDGRSDASEGLGGYAVDDWDEEELETEPTRYSLQGSEAVLVGILFVLYPFLAISAVTPAFSPLVNVVVALCVLALTGYLLTMPRVGFYVFGAWSVLAPALVLALPGLGFGSLVGLVVVGAAWIPFGYSVLFLRVLE